MKRQYAIAWKRWHYDTPEWVVANARFDTLAEAVTERKTFGIQATKIVEIREVA